MQAVRDAGQDVHDLADILRLGHLPDASGQVLEARSAHPAVTVRTCSLLLEQELSLFPELRAILLMGDVAIASLNASPAVPATRG